MSAYVHCSPVGNLLIEAEGTEITRCTFTEQPQSALASEDAVIRQCVNELEEYFSGNLRGFSVRVKLTGTPFQNRVWSELLKIPYGTTISYSELALRLGDPKCIRAAGTANGKNKIPIIIPCHRVIGKDGSLVGFGGGLDKKEWLLKHEGVIRSEQMKIFA